MKLIENIKAVDTGHRRHIEQPFQIIRLTTDKPTDYIPQFARGYSIDVRLGATQWISEDIIKDSGGKVVEHALNEMKHAIIEEVYGELRRDLMDLRMNLRNELSYHDSPSLEKLAKIVEKISL